MSSFIGCETAYENSEVVVFGAPFDGTTSYRPGARFAPAAIRNESYSIETYSPYLDADLCDMKVHDAGDLELCFGNTQRVLEDISSYTKKLIQHQKLPIMLGGEHLVTLGAITAMASAYPDISIIHFDAHADLRDDYIGEKLSHATVMRRCHDLLGDGRIFQFGIRSGCKEEFVFARDHVFMRKFDFIGLDEVVKSLQNKPVYLTVDMDVLDPSTFPGTGTPESGGVSFLSLLDAIFKALDCNIVGIDCNELSPVYDLTGSSTSLACKLLREVLICVSRSRRF